MSTDQHTAWLVAPLLDSGYLLHPPWSAQRPAHLLARGPVTVLCPCTNNRPHRCAAENLHGDLAGPHQRDQGRRGERRAAQPDGAPGRCGEAGRRRQEARRRADRGVRPAQQVLSPAAGHQMPRLCSTLTASDSLCCEALASTTLCHTDSVQDCALLRRMRHRPAALLGGRMLWVMPLRLNPQGLRGAGLQRRAEADGPGQIQVAVHRRHRQGHHREARVQDAAHRGHRGAGLTVSLFTFADGTARSVKTLCKTVCRGIARPLGNGQRSQTQPALPWHRPHPAC
jgi:hypothetical protein